MNPCGQAPFTGLALEERNDSDHSSRQEHRNSGFFESGGDGSDEGDEPEASPQYAHQWISKEAVTTVAYHGSFLFVGTVSGKLITYDLESYQEVSCVEAHTGSILTLIIQDGLLFTGSSDSLIKVWVPGLEPQFRHTVYTLSDIGDIFSLAYNAQSRMLYIGTQNASIHWVRLDDEALRNQRDKLHDKMPAVRPSIFFDSLGPGGKLAPQQEARRSGSEERDTESLVQVPLDNQIGFAHHSAVFAMVLDEKRKILVTGSGDGIVKIWSVKIAGKPIETHRLQMSDTILSMAQASSWQLCCGLNNGAMVVIDLDTFQVIRHEIDRSYGPLLSIAAIEDGVFISSGKDLLAYDATTSELHRWGTPGLITSIITLPKHLTAGQLVTAGSDGSVILWKIFLHAELEGDERALPGRSNSIGAIGTQGSSDSVQMRYKPYKMEPLENDTMIAFLAEIVKYQTVSGRDRQHWADNRRCATALRDRMRLLGAESELLRVEDGNPIVLAEFKANSENPTKSRALFYGHYDVIEAKKDDRKWDTPPFQLVSINGYLYGRGVTDDKGPCTAAIYAAAKLYAEQRLSADVVFLIEGEEESGSFGFQETVQRHMSRIGNIDWIIFSNSLWLDDKRPCLNYGLRGVVFLEIELTSGKGDLHSGVDGGVFREPAKDMINLLAKLTTDSEGQIAIPGFFEAVKPLSEAEELLYEDIVQNTNTSKEDLLHKWRYPSLTIHKLEVSGPQNQTVIPANVKAYISLRLVPSQTASGITTKLSKYLSDEFTKFNSSNSLNVKLKYEADPWLGDPSNRLFRLMAESVENVWGVPPLFIREGGSIPMARALEVMFGAPAAQLPCGQSSDGAHLNNERMRITNIINARKVFEQVFCNIGH